MNRKQPDSKINHPMRAKLATVLILVALVVLFILQNVAIVQINFLLWSIQMSRSLLMLLVLAIGIAIGWLLHSHFRHRAR